MRERGRWEGGGEARFSSLPASPSALQTQCLCNVLRRRETPPAARARGWMRVGAGIAAWCGQPWAHDPDRALLSVLLPPAVPSRIPPRATPWGSPHDKGPAPTPWGADDHHPAGTTAWRATTPWSHPSLPRRHTWEKMDIQRARTHSQNQP